MCVWEVGGWGGGGRVGSLDVDVGRVELGRGRQVEGNGGKVAGVA